MIKDKDSLNKIDDGSMKLNKGNKNLDDEVNFDGDEDDLFID